MTFKFYGFLFLVSFQFSLCQTKAKVIKIKDGDTVVVLLENNQQQTLRLADVDCPESGQAFGKNAKQFTSSQVFGKEITFITTTKDRYGRSIAKIFYDKQKYLSEEIIKSGFGWWYYQYSENNTLKKSEERARKNKWGLWQDKNPISPWEYRKLKRQKIKLNKI